MNTSLPLKVQKYIYTLSKPFRENNETVITFSCPQLKIHQNFLAEDIPKLIKDLPNIAHNIKTQIPQIDNLHH